MKRLLAIGHTDLRLFLKHKSAYVWFFVMPLAFVYIMGFANRGPGDPYNRTPPGVRSRTKTRIFSGGFFSMNSVHRTCGCWIRPTASLPRASSAFPPISPARFHRGNRARCCSSKRDASAQADAALIELRLVRALISMNGHLLETVTATNEPGTISEGKLREIMAAAESGDFERAICRTKARAVRLQLFAAGKSCHVPDDESADLRRRERVRGAAQRGHQTAHGLPGNAPGTCHGKNLRPHAAWVGADSFFPRGGKISISRQPRRESARL